MRKQCKRKVWPIKAPGIRLTERHAAELALQAHIAVEHLDTEQGLDSYINILCTCAVSMELAGTITPHARAILNTCIKHMESALETGRITQAQEDYAKQAAMWIDQWVHGIRYSDFCAAKKAMKAADMRVMKKREEMINKG